jgi:hypothetical protein
MVTETGEFVVARPNDSAWQHLTRTLHDNGNDDPLNKTIESNQNIPADSNNVELKPESSKEVPVKDTQNDGAVSKESSISPENKPKKLPFKIVEPAPAQKEPVAPNPAQMNMQPMGMMWNPMMMAPMPPMQPYFVPMMPMYAPGASKSSSRYYLLTDT